MQLQFSVYVLPLIGAALVSSGVAFYSWRHRSTHSAFALSMLSLAIAEWATAYAFEIMGVDLDTKVFWGKAEYLGIATVSPIWMAFAIQYAGLGRRLTRKNLALLFLIPVITILLVFTTEWHGLVWQDLHIDQGAGFSVLGLSHGIWFWAHITYSYLLLVVGTILILRSVWRAQGLYRGQAIALVIAALTPLVGNILYLSKLSPIPLLDLTPFTFALTVAAISWGIFGFQLLDLSPIARDNIVDEMKDGVIVVDIQGRIADINPAALQMIGQANHNVVGQMARDILKPWQELTERYRDLVEARDEISFGEGEDQRWYELRLSPLHSRDKRLLGRVVTIRNITEPRRAEEFKISFLDDMKALQEIHLILSQVADLDSLYIKMISLAQQRLGIDRMGLFLVNEHTNEFQGTYGVDPDGKVRDERYFRESLTSENWNWTKEVVNLPSHANIWQDVGIFDNAVIVGTGWKAGAALWNGHKTIGFLSCDNFSTKRAARPYEAELISLLGSIFGHLIERLRSDLLLQENELRYRQIVENASDVIYRTNENGLFTYINPVGLKLIGYQREDDLLGKSYLELVAPEFRHRLKRFYDHQLLAREKNSYREFAIAGADGREVWLGQNVQMIEEEGKIIGFQAVARDITELKQAQEALSRARDQALDASRIKSQLLAKVSHELRTPLGGILGYAELLHDDQFGVLDEKQKQATAQIIDSTNYLNAMVSELLDEAQIEAKTVILHKRLFFPMEVLQKVAASMKVLAGHKGLTFTTSLAPEMPETLMGDPHRVQQIIINLVGNAIKFTSSGEVCVNIFQPDQDHWAINVSDTGAGVPVEAQTYIFEAFRQVDNSITRENRGTGLGLSITKQLVELMGGKISVESEVNKGSTFTVLLPILEVPEHKE